MGVLINMGALHCARAGKRERAGGGALGPGPCSNGNHSSSANCKLSVGGLCWPGQQPARRTGGALTAWDWPPSRAIPSPSPPHPLFALSALHERCQNMPRSKQVAGRRACPCLHLPAPACKLIVSSYPPLPIPLLPRGGCSFTSH